MTIFGHLTSNGLETERLLQHAVDRVPVGRTSLVIAHRLRTIRQVDRIIALHQGQVREEGTHDELLAARGFYWQSLVASTSARDGLYSLETG